MTVTDNIYNEQAEEALLGSILINPGLIDEIDLNVDQFYIHRHRLIWQAMRSLATRGVTPDMITLEEELHSRGVLNEVGGTAQLLKILSRTPSSLGLQDYVGIVRDKSRRRALLETASQLAKAAYDADKNLDDQVGTVIDHLAKDVSGDVQAVKISAYKDEFVDFVEARHKEPDRHWSIPVMLKDFMKATGGFQESELFYLAGDPGIGKSMLAMQLWTEAAMLGSPMAIYSIEMKLIKVLIRLVTAKARMSTSLVRSGRLSEAELEQLYAKADELFDLPLYISDEPYMTAAQINADVRRLKRKVDLRGFLVDYAFLLGDGEELEDDARTQLISKRLKTIARGTNTACLAINSVTKDGMSSKYPKLKDMRGSGQMLHDADVVAFLIKNTAMGHNIHSLRFEKVRDLESCGYINLYKHPNYPLFSDAEIKAAQFSPNGNDDEEIAEPWYNK